MSRVTVIGAGNVGASLAQLVAHAGLADVVLFDLYEGVAKGKALDLMEACPLWGSATVLSGTADFADTKGSDVVVITAGFARKPGMSRDDLLKANAKIVTDVARGAAEHSPRAVIIVVTNPMDVMAYVAYKASGFDKSRVVGMGGVLDSARLRAFIAMELGVSPADVEAMVLGGHGDQMVPVPGYMRVKGMPLAEMVDEETLSALIERTMNGGAEIVGLLKTGSAYYAPGAAAFEMVKAIVMDEKRVLPCSAYLEGHYGVEGLFMGVPVVLGAGGVEKVVELGLDEGARAGLERSAEAVGSMIKKLDI